MVLAGHRSLGGIDCCLEVSENNSYTRDPPDKPLTEPPWLMAVEKGTD
jgi:hypothetical protein